MSDNRRTLLESSRYRKVQLQSSDLLGNKSIELVPVGSRLGGRNSLTVHGSCLWLGCFAGNW